MKKTSRRRVDVNVEELDRVIDETEKGPLSEADRHNLRTTLHALVESLRQRRNNETTNTVLGDRDSPEPAEKEPAKANEEANENKPAGHGRNGAHTYRGAEKVKPQWSPQIRPTVVTSKPANDKAIGTSHSFTLPG